MRLPVRAPLPGTLRHNHCPASRAPIARPAYLANISRPLGGLGFGYGLPGPPVAIPMAAPGGLPCGGSPWGLGRALGGLAGSGAASRPPGPLRAPIRGGRPYRAAWRLSIPTKGRGRGLTGSLTGPGASLAGASLAWLMGQQYGRAGGAWAINIAPGAGSHTGPLWWLGNELRRGRG